MLQVKIDDKFVQDAQTEDVVAIELDGGVIAIEAVENDEEEAIQLEVFVKGNVKLKVFIDYSDPHNIRVQQM